MENINEIISHLCKTSLDFENALSKSYARETGSYYTDLYLAIDIVDELISHLDSNLIFSKKFLEPCVGTGNFVMAYLIVCSRFNFALEDYRKIVNNIYVCDINQNAIDIYKQNLTFLVNELFGFDLTDDYFASHVGGGLLYDFTSEAIEYIPIQDVFSDDIVGNGFDIIVTNPPYKSIKSDIRYLNRGIESFNTKNLYVDTGKLARDHFKYSLDGTLNIYKLFVEEIVEKYLSPNGYCSLLIPSSMLSDITCANLRSFLLKNCNIFSIELFNEDNSHLKSLQALCTFSFQKGCPTKTISIKGSLSKNSGDVINLSVDDIFDEKNGNPILVLSTDEYKIRKILNQFPRIKDLDFIINRRGELDISFNKSSIVNYETQYKFYRGRNIGFYNLLDGNFSEYVNPEFVENTPKKEFIFKERIACQQIVNMKKDKRIAFVKIPPLSVLGNSCNFIALKDNPYGIDYYFLLGLLNSSVIEWYFKATSSNNHINNYEIDNFPIPIDYPKKQDISHLAKKYESKPDSAILEEIDRLVFEAYNLGDCKL